MTKHTPGPWFLEENSVDGMAHIKDGAGGRICEMYHLGEGYCNANLIAAAPKMLDKLKEYQVSLEMMIAEGYVLLKKNLEEVDSLIKEAEGIEFIDHDLHTEPVEGCEGCLIDGGLYDS